MAEEPKKEPNIVIKPLTQETFNAYKTRMEPVITPMKEKETLLTDVTDFVKAMASGALFDLDDEALAGIKSILGQGKYDELVALERAKKQIGRDRSPALSLAGTLAGGLIMPGGAALNSVKLAKGATGAAKAARFAKDAAKFAPYGALQGVGNSDADFSGEDTSGAQEQLFDDALGGAAMGVAGGAVIGSLGAVGKKIAQSDVIQDHIVKPFNLGKRGFDLTDTSRDGGFYEKLTNKVKDLKVPIIKKYKDINTEFGEVLAQPLDTTTLNPETLTKITSLMANTKSAVVEASEKIEQEAIKLAEKRNLLSQTTDPKLTNLLIASENKFAENKVKTIRAALRSSGGDGFERDSVSFFTEKLGLGESELFDLLKDSASLKLGGSGAEATEYMLGQMSKAIRNAQEIGSAPTFTGNTLKTYLNDVDNYVGLNFKSMPTDFKTNLQSVRKELGEIGDNVPGFADIKAKWQQLRRPFEADLNATMPGNYGDPGFVGISDIGNFSDQIKQVSGIIDDVVFNLNPKATSGTSTIRTSSSQEVKALLDKLAVEMPELKNITSEMSDIQDIMSLRRQILKMPLESGGFSEKTIATSAIKAVSGSETITGMPPAIANIVGGAMAGGKAGAIGTSGKVLSAITSAPFTAISALGRKLSDVPELAKYGDQLIKASDNKSRTSLNAVMFTMMQSPEARKVFKDIMGISDSD